MTEDTPTLEAEVVAIDGVSVPPSTTNGSQKSSHKRTLHQWQNTLGNLDRRWWPLIALIGSMILAVAIFIGTIALVLFMALKVLQSTVRALVSQPGAHSTGTAT